MQSMIEQKDIKIASIELNNDDLKKQLDIKKKHILKMKES